MRPILISFWLLIGINLSGCFAHNTKHGSIYAEAEIEFCENSNLQWQSLAEKIKQELYNQATERWKKYPIPKRAKKSALKYAVKIPKDDLKICLHSQDKAYATHYGNALTRSSLSVRKSKDLQLVRFKTKVLGAKFRVYLAKNDSMFDYNWVTISESVYNKIQNVEFLKVTTNNNLR